MAYGESSQVSLGTSPPIFVPSSYPSDPIRVGADYFTLRICAAQAAFVGSIWSKVKALLVSTQVSLHHPSIGERGLRSLQQTRAVNSNVDEQLGLAVNLVDLTPAVMAQVSVSIDFNLDKESRLAKLATLVNKDSFSAVLSLAPGAVAIAKTVSALAQDIIQTFLPAEEQEPILQFTGDFNLATEGLRPGYYVILGSRDADNPIPTSLPAITMKEGRLHSNGRAVSGLSYVVIEVRKTSARSRDLGIGTPWDDCLREAEDVAQGLIDDPLASADDRRSSWAKCQSLLREAQTFLRADPTYLRSEAEQIVKAAYLRCREVVSEPSAERHLAVGKAAAAVWLPDDGEDRKALGIAANDDLVGNALAYARDVNKSRETLADW